MNGNKDLAAEQLDLECVPDEGEDISVFRIYDACEEVKEELILIVCYMTVEGMNMSENIKKYKMLSDLTEKYRNSCVLVAGDMNGHTGCLDESVNNNGRLLLDFAEDKEYEILNHTIGQGKVTWKGRQFESAIDYMLVNQVAREKIKELIVDEEGDFDIDTDHNALILSYQWGNNDKRNNREVGTGNGNIIPRRSDFYWKCRGRDYSGFEADLSELDCLYGMNPAELNDCLVKRINQTALKHFKKGRFDKNEGKKKVNKNWWNEEVEKAVKERRKTNREKRRAERNFRRGDISEEALNDYWNEYRKAKDEAGKKIGEAIRSYENSILMRAKEQGNGENKEWYSFIKGDKGSFEYPKSIKVNGELLNGYTRIKEEIEKYMNGIAGEDKGNMKYSSDKESLELSGDVVINMERPDIGEIRSTLKELKDNKGVGMDGIPYEFFKKGRDMDRECPF